MNEKIKEIEKRIKKYLKDVDYEITENNITEDLWLDGYNINRVNKDYLKEFLENLIKDLKSIDK